MVISSKQQNKTTKQPTPSVHLFWKFSFLILLISIFGYFVIYQRKTCIDIPLKSLGKTGEFFHETWSIFSLSTRLIYRRLLTKQLSVDAISKQLLAEEQLAQPRVDAKIAIGLGVCNDLVVEALDVLAKFRPPSLPKPHDVIDSWEQFLELFAYYFQNGAASERYIRSKQVFQKLIDQINQNGIHKKQMIGGNAALMSLRFAREGFKHILLGAQISQELLKQFPRNFQISGPQMEFSDYHVMLEYKTNQKWEHYTSPRANRLIVHSDDNNVKLLARKEFFRQLENFKPNLLIITGLHILDNSPIDFQERSQAVESLAQDIRNAEQSYQSHNDDSFRAHFEMGSFTENRLLDSVVNQIFPHIDSFGMNEQEMSNLVQFIRYGNISYVSNPFPRVAIVLDQMRELFSLLQMIGGERVSRIHVHTLAYQVVMTKIDGQSQRPIWPNGKTAMAKASLTAYRFTCNLEQVDLNRANIFLDDSFSTSAKTEDDRGGGGGDSTDRITLDQAVKCWEESLPSSETTGKVVKVQICLAIGLVCTKVVQTGGAGDNVSAAGILQQV